MKHLSGSCLCGKVAVQVADKFGFVGYCHCEQCRKWSGSAFATGALVDADDLRVTSGEELVSWYRQSGETELAFCSNCGASLFSKKPQAGKFILRLGILDDAPTQQPNVHIFAASKAPWFEITDQLARFDELP